jgi:hypothetical protein
MALNSEWVDAIFARLALTYGQRFMALYSGLQPEHVKAMWADELDGINTRGITHAYANLPPDHPPNALQFRALCRAAYAPERLELPAPKVPPKPADLARLAAAMKPLSHAHDPRAWADRLKAREDAGEHLSRLQREAWRSSRRIINCRASGE